MTLEGASVNSVDASGRVALREHVVDDLDGSVILTQGFDQNLLMFSPEQWEEFKKRFTSKDDVMDPDVDDLRRLFIAPATEVELDDRGRIKIPETLRDWAGLKPGQSRAMVLNIDTRWEVWEQERYNQYMSSRRSDLKEFARMRFSRRQREAEDREQ